MAARLRAHGVKEFRFRLFDHFKGETASGHQGAAQRADIGLEGQVHA